ncbi:MAG: DUF805 domain-containing protein [Veillonella sp.]|nr:DUF805 domain-containing protein [Veillonella sp.]
MPVFENRKYSEYSLSYKDILKVSFSPYFSFKGRSSRSEYWRFTLLASIIPNVFYTLALWLSSEILIGLAILLGLAFFLPQWAIGVRRLHDTNRSGWWLLLSFVPLIGSIWLLILLASKGTDGDNDYGPKTGYIQIDEAMSNQLGLGQTPSTAMTAALIIVMIILSVIVNLVAALIH